jgi:type IV pilus assembly protein PilC
MPKFVAQVVDSTGRVSKQSVEAVSIQQAAALFRSQFPRVGKIKRSSINLNINLLPFFDRNFGNISIKDKALFSRQFSVMINAGVAIVRCLNILQEQCTNNKLKRVLRDVTAEVQEGNNLADSMKKHPQCFDELYVSMVEAGESGGVLDEVLERLSNLYEDMAKLRNQIISALAYPLVVLIIAILAFFGMTIFLVPTFAKIFEQIHATLPPLTQFMVFLSEVLRSWLIIIPIAIILAILFLLVSYYKTPVGRRQIDLFKLKMPLFGNLNQKSSIALFSRILGTLLKSGVPILQSLDIVSKTLGNRVIADAVQNAKSDIQQGGEISLALQKARVFPPMSIQMINVGEETGELDAMLMKIADFYEDEVTQAVKALTSLIEPILIVFVATIVGTILLAMYMPLFSIYDQLQG